MMMDKIIDINSSIDIWYRESKLPKFIKIIVAKIKRKKLKKYIKRYTSGIYYRKIDIFLFLYYCFRLYPPKGEFEYIRDIKEIITDEEFNNQKNNNTVSYSARLRYGDTNIIYDYDLNVSNKSDNIDLQISIITDKGTKRLKFSKDILLVDDDSILSDLIRGLNSMIAEMIEIVLNNELIRSERIYEL